MWWVGKALSLNFFIEYLVVVSFASNMSNLLTYYCPSLSLDVCALLKNANKNLDLFGMYDCIVLFLPTQSIYVQFLNSKDPSNGAHSLGCTDLVVSCKKLYPTWKHTFNILVYPNEGHLESSLPAIKWDTPMFSSSLRPSLVSQFSFEMLLSFLSLNKWSLPVCDFNHIYFLLIICFRGLVHLVDVFAVSYMEFATWCTW